MFLSSIEMVPNSALTQHNYLMDFLKMSNVKRLWVTQTALTMTNN